MEGDINVGDMVIHKVNARGEAEGKRLVVIRKIDTKHGYTEYECRWYNGLTGSYEKGSFYNSELIKIS